MRDQLHPECSRPRPVAGLDNEANAASFLNADWHGAEVVYDVDAGRWREG
jgi:hypothetical protein